MAANWVVKLGGSLFASSHLPFWLEALAATNAVIAPGGGPFADQVRAAEARWRFGDDTAHAMALLAMAQYGRMLAGICPRLRTSATLAGLDALAEAGSSTVWLPDPAQLPEAEIPATWDLTSDSLSAWLAGRLGARRLLLVKSAVPPKAEASAARLARDGLVDPWFPRLTANASYEIWLTGPEHHARLAQGLLEPEHLFAPVMAGP